MPRIYVADLAEYNAGSLVGRWIDLEEVTTPEEVHEVIQRHILRAARTGHEEWAIHDFEGFGPIRLSEYETIENVCALAEAIADVDDAQAFTEYVDHVGGMDYFSDAAQAVSDFEEAFIGQMTPLDYAHQYVDDSGMFDGANETVQSYFDYERFARDMELGGDIHETAGGYLFHGNI